MAPETHENVEPLGFIIDTGPTNERVSLMASVMVARFTMLQLEKILEPEPVNVAPPRRLRAQFDVVFAPKKPVPLQKKVLSKVADDDTKTEPALTLTDENVMLAEGGSEMLLPRATDKDEMAKTVDGGKLPCSCTIA